MKVKSLDKNTRNFLAYSGILLAAFVLFLAALSFVYRNFTLDAYNWILFFLILFTLVIIISIAIIMLSVVTVCKRRRVPAVMRLPLKTGLKMMLPATAVAAGLLEGSKDSIRRLYVDLNNIMVESGNMKYKPEEVLVLLPHCLQNSGCSYKITNDIENCRQCGKCCIGSILKLAGEKGVKVVAVTGGTVARNIVKQLKPKIMLSVACERDLTSGIADVVSIPVIGVLNERPNGPCRDTNVDMELFKNKLEMILKDKEK